MYERGAMGATDIDFHEYCEPQAVQGDHSQMSASQTRPLTCPVAHPVVVYWVAPALHVPSFMHDPCDTQLHVELQEYVRSPQSPQGSTFVDPAAHVPSFSQVDHAVQTPFAHTRLR
jgi:hypothetical protein